MKKLNLLLPLLALLLFCLPALSLAQTSNNSGRASITVVPTLSLTLVASPIWGTVTAPVTGTTNYTLNTTTGVVTATSGTGFSFGDSNAGNYTVAGGASEPITYSVSIGAFSGTGVTVVTPYVNGTAATGTGNLSAMGVMTLLIGGVLAVDSTATGTQTATVTVTVNYA